MTLQLIMVAAITINGIHDDSPFLIFYEIQKIILTIQLGTQQLYMKF
jgi:hypothetical protein